MPENFDEKRVKVSDESKEDIDDLPKLVPRMLEPTPIVVERVRNQVVADGNRMDQWERDVIQRTSEDIQETQRTTIRAMGHTMRLNKYMPNFWEI